MKMVKSLLLGSAAGLVAVVGAQAADLPVKAKPVQYVKICTLYGVGFYYIPGTDMCLKIGGWVRAEYAYGGNSSLTWGWFNGNTNSAGTSNSTWRARGYITADARNQTEYGTVRSYIAVGVNTNDIGLNSPTNTFSANRAFIQWAGFTFGLAQSFYDFYSVPATSYWGSFPASDTGDPGWMVAGYTAQFGNGFSATLAAEQRRITQIINTGEGFNGTSGAIFTSAGGSILPGGTSPGAYGGFQWPDIVGNLRVDQAWGSAQIMGAIHQVNALYYGTTGADATSLGDSNRSARPSDEVGWVIGAGLKWNFPWIGTGDYFQTQVNYTQGAVKYVFQTPNSNWGKTDGYAAGYGILSDAVYGGSFPGGSQNTGLELTTAFGVNAAYEHFWNPRWKTSLYGGYAKVEYSGLANNLLCGFGANDLVDNGCDSNWQTWWLGSRTQWNVTKDFYMGVDVLYSKLQTANFGNDCFGAPCAIQSATTHPFEVPAKDVDNWAFRFRVHRDFYP